MSKKIVILGSTGSVGRQALDVVDELGDEIKIEGLGAGTNCGLLAQQVRKYRPRYVSVASEHAGLELRNRLGNCKTEIITGMEAMAHLAGLDGIDLILVAVSGINGLLPTLTALEKKTTVALANKESLVTAGNLVMAKAREKETLIIPVDSEHSAIFQCLEERNSQAVEKIILTASGGPFNKLSKEELAQVTPEMALRHPNWQMGPKITIDSAGMINKGLEVIEAHWLFDLPYEKIQVVIHPQSIIHSMVQYADGAILAQMGLPDMKTPIQLAFTYPQRRANSFAKPDFYNMRDLTFAKPDTEQFPGLALAYEAGRIDGTMPTVYNAANEEAVMMFLDGKIRFTHIPVIIQKVMERHSPQEITTVEQVLDIDRWARIMAHDMISL